MAYKTIYDKVSKSKKNKIFGDYNSSQYYAPTDIASYSTKKSGGENPLWTLLDSLSAPGAAIRQQIYDWTDNKLDWKDIPLANSLVHGVRGQLESWRDGSFDLNDLPMFGINSGVSKGAVTGKEFAQNRLGMKNARDRKLGEVKHWWQAIDPVDLVGFGVEALTDPLSYVSGGAESAVKAARIAQQTHILEKAAELGLDVAKNRNTVKMTDEFVAKATAKKVKEIAKTAEGQVNPEFVQRFADDYASKLRNEAMNVGAKTRFELQNKLGGFKLPGVNKVWTFGEKPNLFKIKDPLVDAPTAEKITQEFANKGYTPEQTQKYLQDIYNINSPEEMTNQAFRHYMENTPRNLRRPLDNIMFAEKEIKQKGKISGSKKPVKEGKATVQGEQTTQDVVERLGKLNTSQLKPDQQVEYVRVKENVQQIGKDVGALKRAVASGKATQKQIQELADKVEKGLVKHEAQTPRFARVKGFKPIDTAKVRGLVEEQLGIHAEQAAQTAEEAGKAVQNAIKAGEPLKGTLPTAGETVGSAIKQIEQEFNIGGKPASQSAKAVAKRKEHYRKIQKFTEDHPELAKRADAFSEEDVFPLRGEITVSKVKQRLDALERKAKQGTKATVVKATKNVVEQIKEDVTAPKPEETVAEAPKRGRGRPPKEKQNVVKEPTGQRGRPGTREPQIQQFLKDNPKLNEEDVRKAFGRTHPVTMETYLARTAEKVPVQEQRIREFLKKNPEIDEATAREAFKGRRPVSMEQYNKHLESLKPKSVVEQIREQIVKPKKEPVVTVPKREQEIRQFLKDNPKLDEAEVRKLYEGNRKKISAADFVKVTPEDVVKFELVDGLDEQQILDKLGLTSQEYEKITSTDSFVRKYDELVAARGKEAEEAKKLEQVESTGELKVEDVLDKNGAKYMPKQIPSSKVGDVMYSSYTNLEGFMNDLFGVEVTGHLQKLSSITSKLKPSLNINIAFKTADNIPVSVMKDADMKIAEFKKLFEKGDARFKNHFESVKQLENSIQSVTISKAFIDKAPQGVKRRFNEMFGDKLIDNGDGTVSIKPKDIKGKIKLKTESVDNRPQFNDEDVREIQASRILAKSDSLSVVKDAKSLKEATSYIDNLLYDNNYSIDDSRTLKKMTRDLQDHYSYSDVLKVREHMATVSRHFTSEAEREDALNSLDAVLNELKKQVETTKFTPLAPRRLNYTNLIPELRDFANTHEYSKLESMTHEQAKASLDRGLNLLSSLGFKGIYTSTAKDISATKDVLWKVQSVSNQMHGIFNALKDFNVDIEKMDLSDLTLTFAKESTLNIDGFGGVNEAGAYFLDKGIGDKHIVLSSDSPYLFTHEFGHYIAYKYIKSSVMRQMRKELVNTDKFAEKVSKYKLSESIRGNKDLSETEDMINNYFSNAEEVFARFFENIVHREVVIKNQFLGKYSKDFVDTLSESINVPHNFIVRYNEQILSKYMKSVADAINADGPLKTSRSGIMYKLEEPRLGFNSKQPPALPNPLDKAFKPAVNNEAEYARTQEALKFHAGASIANMTVEQADAYVRDTRNALEQVGVSFVEPRYLPSDAPVVAKTMQAITEQMHAVRQIVGDIKFSGLKFKISPDNNPNMLASYAKATSTITVSRNGRFAIAHEIGHFLADRMPNKADMKELVSSLKGTTQFRKALDKVMKSKSPNVMYWKSDNEVFARAFEEAVLNQTGVQTSLRAGEVLGLQGEDVARIAKALGVNKEFTDDIYKEGKAFLDEGKKFKKVPTFQETIGEQRYYGKNPLKFQQDMGGNVKALTPFTASKIFNARSLGSKNSFVDTFGADVSKTNLEYDGGKRRLVMDLNKVDKLAKGMTQAELDAVAYVIEDFFPQRMSKAQFFKAKGIDGNGIKRIDEFAKQYTEILGKLGREEQEVGLLKQMRRNYFPHIYELSDKEAEQIFKELADDPKLAGLRGRSAKNGFANERKGFQTMAELSDYVDGLRGKIAEETDPAKVAKMQDRLTKLEKTLKMKPVDVLAKRYATSIRSTVNKRLYNKLEKAGMVVKKGVASSRDDLIKITTPEQARKLGLQIGDRMQKDVYEGLKRMDSIFTDEGLNKFLKNLDAVHSIWKRSVTTLIPRHYVTNVIGHAFNNALAGVETDSYVEAGKLLRNVKNNKLTPQDAKFIRAAQDRGIIGQGFLSDFRRYTQFGATEKMFGDKVADFIGNVGNKATMGLGSKYVHTLEKVGQSSDDYFRLAHFYDIYKKTGNLDMAADSVKKYLFNYKELTNTDRMIRAGFIPFWTWMRNNIPLQLEKMFTEPRFILTWYKTKRSMQGSVSESDAPDWANQTGFVFNNYVYNPQLPVTDVTRIVNTPKKVLQEIGASLNPTLRMPTEIALNKQFFSDKPISYPNSETPSKDYFNYLLKNAGPAGMIAAKANQTPSTRNPDKNKVDPLEEIRKLFIPGITKYGQQGGSK